MLQSNQKIIRHKVGLLNLAEELWNVSKACQVMGLSRDTFYRYRDAVTEGGVEALKKKKLDNEAWGKIETAHPGYLGSQDTFYLCRHPQGRRTGLGGAGVSPETPRARTGTSIRRQMTTYQALSRRRIKRDQGVRTKKALKNDDIRTTR